MTIDLRRLAEPFPPGDIEWRVSRAGLNKKGDVFCMVLAYITARAIANRLDAVVGPGNWSNTPLGVKELRPGIAAMEVGISILIDGAWVTKFDVSEPTNIEPAKGGFSGAMKRAGAQWGIGRYLYLLDETFAETSESGGKGWEYARLPEKQGGGSYYWKPPHLPAWALPVANASEKPVSQAALNDLKQRWIAKFAPSEKNRQVLATKFRDFAHSIVGEFPVDELSCWTQQIMDDCLKRLSQTVDANGPSADVPFE
jgi:hypothetical protein